MDLYGSPRKRKRRSPATFRPSANLERGINALMMLWKAEAPARGDKPEEITFSHVLSRLLGVGLDGAFEEIKKDAGLKRMPESDAEWEQFDQALGRRLKR